MHNSLGNDGPEISFTSVLVASRSDGLAMSSAPVVGGRPGGLAENVLSVCPSFSSASASSCWWRAEQCLDWLEVLVLAVMAVLAVVADGSCTNGACRWGGTDSECSSVCAPTRTRNRQPGLPLTSGGASSSPPSSVGPARDAPPRGSNFGGDNFGAARKNWHPAETKKFAHHQQAGHASAARTHTRTYTDIHIRAQKQPEQGGPDEKRTRKWAPAASSRTAMRALRNEWPTRRAGLMIMMMT